MKLRNLFKSDKDFDITYLCGCHSTISYYKALTSSERRKLKQNMESQCCSETCTAVRAKAKYKWQRRYKGSYG
jgi:hypothetical protein